MLILNHIKITPRDREVLQLLMEGCSNKEIAAQLKISPRTVKQHFENTFSAGGDSGWKKTGKTRNRDVRQGADDTCNHVNT